MTSESVDVVARLGDIHQLGVLGGGRVTGSSRDKQSRVNGSPEMHASGLREEMNRSI